VAWYMRDHVTTTFARAPNNASRIQVSMVL
jgi:hypothetical protein